jgi:hypothetical protein
MIMENLVKLRMMFFLILPTIYSIAQVAPMPLEKGKTNKSQKLAMSVKCDCCNSTYSPEKISDHAKTCCKTNSDAHTATATAKQNSSVKCDCCNSTYSPEKIADHAKACCKTNSDSNTNMTSNKTAKMKLCTCCKSDVPVEKMGNHSKGCCAKSTDPNDMKKATM